VDNVEGIADEEVEEGADSKMSDLGVSIDRYKRTKKASKR
jgi:hypothetical protein